MEDTERVPVLSDRIIVCLYFVCFVWKGRGKRLAAFFAWRKGDEGGMMIGGRLLFGLLFSCKCAAANHEEF
ncbi:hypothetical protein LX69_02498 [Breznakibacter xylanolyticus]|uniref:Uncharacterized protein n=1 Tax=Breznakibacter xylanolyticus TaxID=990 RepID=A0A2W7PW48_9BACT|nr:hypothetical protein LX69_02498 [Breznakibacter xylanolyticus]